MLNCFFILPIVTTNPISVNTPPTVGNKILDASVTQITSVGLLGLYFNLTFEPRGRGLVEEELCVFSYFTPFTSYSTIGAFS